jgi:hypothetical protein
MAQSCAKQNLLICLEEKRAGGRGEEGEEGRGERAGGRGEEGEEKRAGGRGEEGEEGRGEESWRERRGGGRG